MVDNRYISTTTTLNDLMDQTIIELLKNDDDGCKIYLKNGLNICIFRNMEVCNGLKMTRCFYEGILGKVISITSDDSPSSFSCNIIMEDGEITIRYEKNPDFPHEKIFIRKYIPEV